MARRMRSFGTLAVVFCILLISATPAMAADVAQRSQVALTEVRSTGISWQPLIDFKSAVLTMSGPDGFVMSREFGRGELLQVQVVDKQGYAFADGGYTWELSFSPTVEPAVRRALEKARESGDEKAVAELRRNGKLPEGAVISGFFRVHSGSIVTPDKAESAAAVERSVSEPDMGDAGGAAVASADKDQVILDDLIVDGSACIGQDCVNGESFGFDTIRIKENNLRIKAQDTSSTASFPTRDWQITFNDSSNGGQNKFSIDDIDGGRTPFTIEASAPSNSLYVDDGGRVGFSTSVPVTDLHVVSGNTPTLRLEQNGSSGFTPQTWDLAGNEANFFIRDVTNGSTLPFRIFPGAPSSALTIEASTGDVGVGTTSPEEELHVESQSGGNAALMLDGVAAGGVEWIIRSQSNDQLQIRDDTGGTIPMRIAGGADTNLLQLGVIATNQVDITGNLVVSGTITPDYVFEPGYQLESIEEHAEYMWTYKHLPAVGAATLRPDGSHAVNVGARSQSMLEELEKAHIYIEQLHTTIQDMQERLEKLESGSSE